MLNTYIPRDILNIILDYYGKIKYLPKKGIYINIINKKDYRYDIIQLLIIKKINLINLFNIGNNDLKFYIDIYFKKEIGVILSKKII